MAKKKNTRKITLELDSDLLDAVEKSLQSRGTDVETYIRLQMRAFRQAKSLLRLGDAMTFGKYAGEVVETICRAEPGYVEWLIGNGTRATFDTDVLQLLFDLAAQAKAEKTKT